MNWTTLRCARSTEEASPTNSPLVRLKLRHWGAAKFQIRLLADSLSDGLTIVSMEGVASFPIMLPIGSAEERSTAPRRTADLTKQHTNTVTGELTESGPARIGTHSKRVRVSNV